MRRERCEVRAGLATSTRCARIETRDAHRLPDRRGCHSRRCTDRSHGYGFRCTGTAHELTSRCCISSHPQLLHSRAHPFMPQSALINAALLSHSDPGLMNSASGQRSYRAKRKPCDQIRPKFAGAEGGTPQSSRPKYIIGSVDGSIANLIDSRNPYTPSTTKEGHSLSATTWALTSRSTPLSGRDGNEI